MQISKKNKKKEIVNFTVSRRRPRRVDDGCERLPRISAVDASQNDAALGGVGRSVRRGRMGGISMPIVGEHLNLGVKFFHEL